MKTARKLFLILIILFELSSFRSFSQTLIAVSKISATYEKWLHSADPGLVIVNMYGMKVDSALEVLASCSGLLMTGGEDVNPEYYGKQNERSKCEEIDGYRDTLEIALIHRAIKLKMPVFGICRGEQILNVALGGSLYTDIPTDKGTMVTHRCPPGSADCLHSVNIEKKSVLYQLTGIENGTVNSFHHQAIDRVAPGMKVTARSDNGVAEALERENPRGKSFVMGVQWHPERLSANPGLSKPLADNFIAKIAAYSRDNKNCCRRK